MMQSNNILLDQSINQDDLNISISRKSSETPMNTNDLSLLTAITKRKKLINCIKNYINKYDKIALSHLKQWLLWQVHTIINDKIITIPKTDKVTYLQNHIDTLMSYIFYVKNSKKKTTLLRSFGMKQK